MLFMCRERTDRDGETWDTPSCRKATVAGKWLIKRKPNGQEREDRVLGSQESEGRERESLLLVEV